MIQSAEQKYMEFLPAIYQENALLYDFLRPFAHVLNGFDDLLAEIDRYFSPAFTDPEFLPWLAGWVALVLDQEWDETKRRQIIAEAVALYRSRGTVDGLKRYLQIYTGYEPDIREWRWPGGMQIGVSSQIGGPDPDRSGLPVRIPVPKDSNNPSGDTYETHISHVALDQHKNDYYVVDTFKTYQNQQGETERRHVYIYYRASKYKRVERGTYNNKPYVRLIPASSGGSIITHENANIRRESGVNDSVYTIGLKVIKSEQEHELLDYRYIGDTVMVDEMEDQPYRFIVDVRLPKEQLAEGKLESVIEKVRRIVALEKPAHTTYYLKTTSVARLFELRPLQIEIEQHCEIGVHSYIG